MSSELKLAIVGCGAICEWHVDALASVPRIAITTTVDTDLEKAKTLAESVGAVAFDDLSAALSHGTFDAAAVLVPPLSHEPVTLELLAAGRHVLLEKPIATTLAASDRLVEAARRANVVFMVAENTQYWPSVLIAQQLIADGAIGALVTARAARAQTHAEQWYGGEAAWRKDRNLAGGGIALDVGTHWIRPLRMMVGEIDEVVAALDHPFKSMQGESLVRSLLRFRSGLIGSFDAYMTGGARGEEPVFRITGAEGEITVDHKGSVRLYDQASPAGREVGDGRGYMTSYALEHEDFAAAVLDGRPLAAEASEGIAELRTALAIYRSAESGRWEEVWS